MNQLTYLLTLDAKRAGNQGTLQAYAGDAESRCLCVTLISGGKRFDITPDCTVIAKILKPSGEVEFSECSISDNKIYHTLRSSEISEPGTTIIQLVLYGGDAEITIEDGQYRVDGNAKVLACPEIAIEVFDAIASDKSAEASDNFTALTAALIAAQQYSNNTITGVEINSSGELIITYHNGTTANLGTVVGEKGDKGEQGETGSAGEAGFSPNITIVPTDTGHDVTITSLAHPEGETFIVENGEKGDKGDPGAKGDPGKDGVDGVNGKDGADGEVTYDYLGSHCANAIKNTVTGQTSYEINDASPLRHKIKVSGDATKIIAKSANIFDKTTATSGKGINYASGEEINDTSLGCSGYIAVTPNTDYYFDYPTYYGTNRALVWYDSNYHYISGARYTGTAVGARTSPKNAAFVRFGYILSPTSETVRPYVADVDQIMVVEGSTAPTRYSGYQNDTFTDLSIAKLNDDFAGTISGFDENDAPAGLSVTYNQDLNKVIASLQAMILNK